MSCHVRFSVQSRGIVPDRLEAIKEAIRSHFPEWDADEWLWQYYQHERIVLGELDGRDFEPESGYE